MKRGQHEGASSVDSSVDSSKARAGVCRSESVPVADRSSRAQSRSGLALGVHLRVCATTSHGCALHRIAPHRTSPHLVASHHRRAALLPRPLPHSHGRMGLMPGARLLLLLVLFLLASLLPAASADPILGCGGFVEVRSLPLCLSLLLLRVCTLRFYVPYHVCIFLHRLLPISPN